MIERLMRDQFGGKEISQELQKFGWEVVSKNCHHPLLHFQSTTSHIGKQWKENKTCTPRDWVSTGSGGQRAWKLQKRQGYVANGRGGKGVGVGDGEEERGREGRSPLVLLTSYLCSIFLLVSFAQLPAPAATLNIVSFASLSPFTW